jgi:hypothetical protein
MLSWGGKNIGSIGSIVSIMNMDRCCVRWVPGACGALTRVALYPVAQFLQESRQAVGSCKACDNEDEWPSIIKESIQVTTANARVQQRTVQISILSILN